jgi:hypothetical protein
MSQIVEQKIMKRAIPSIVDQFPGPVGAFENCLLPLLRPVWRAQGIHNLKIRPITPARRMACRLLKESLDEEQAVNYRLHAPAAPTSEVVEGRSKI